jgi:hypothetical protein
MAELTVPKVDFSPLGNLGTVYKQARNERRLSDLGKMLADGSVDYRTAAGQVADMGDINSTLKFLALAEQEKQKKLELQASTDFNKGIGGIFGGGQPTRPGAQAVGVPSLRDLGPQAGPPVASAPKAWGDDEGVNAGIYDKPATPGARPPMQVASDGVSPPRAQSAPAPQAAPVQLGAEHVPAILGSLTNPNTPAHLREIGKTLLTEAFKNMKEPEKITTLRALKADPTLLDVETQLKKAGAVNVNVDKGETKFDEKLGEGQAKRWNSYIEAGQKAERELTDINSMREISRRIGSQGAATNIKEAVGPYAEALGINIDGLSDIQAYSSIIQRLAPQQRAEGSGSTSDVEFKGFLKSLPVLSQNPAAREVTLDTMEAFKRDDIARGVIASRLAAKEINRTDAEKQLRALPDPMKGFVDWRKANPEAYSQAVGGKAPPGAAKQVPFTKVEIDQSLANARAAIAKNPAAREAVIKKLVDNGLDPSGL